MWVPDRCEGDEEWEKLAHLVSSLSGGSDIEWCYVSNSQVMPRVRGGDNINFHKLLTFIYVKN